MSKFTETKWLPILVAAGVGIALMFLLVNAFKSAILSATGGGLLGITVGIAAAYYFVTGLIAGVWTRQTRPGISAALVVLVVNIIYNIGRGTFAGAGAQLFVAIIILVVFAIGVGSLGGFVGKLIRR